MQECYGPTLVAISAAGCSKSGLCELPRLSPMSSIRRRCFRWESSTVLEHANRTTWAGSMGIEVSNTKVVNINDQHDSGVDTAAQGNPTRRRFKTMSLIHVFRRNLRDSRQDNVNKVFADTSTAARARHGTRRHRVSH